MNIVTKYELRFIQQPKLLISMITEVFKNISVSNYLFKLYRDILNVKHGLNCFNVWYFS